MEFEREFAMKRKREKTRELDYDGPTKKLLVPQLPARRTCP